ncbi:MAG TPA: SDR family oxidoreductase [Blastocatellia bacterium]|jgi:NAD(P)-dependent dehydrogenase (short-subunit alcohol dehydrogenase family)
MRKTVLITGASSGIGKATAELFYERGWNVAATMRTPETAAPPDSDARLARIRLDVTDIASIKQAIDEAIKRFGSIDAVVNNAGYGMVGPFEASTPEQVERQFQTNVFGLMNVTRELLPYFRERRAGVILNVSSMGGRITFPLYSVYHATKWAVEGFSESLQFEVRPFNIRVKIIEPGPIKTDFYDRSMDVVSRPGLAAYDDYVKRAFPNMQRAGEKAPPAGLVAKAIYRAATDSSWKMRYPANASMILSLRRILPLSIFTGIVRRAVLR